MLHHNKSLPEPLPPWRGVEDAISLRAWVFTLGKRERISNQINLTHVPNRFFRTLTPLRTSGRNTSHVWDTGHSRPIFSRGIPVQTKTMRFSMHENQTCARNPDQLTQNHALCNTFNERPEKTIMFYFWERAVWGGGEGKCIFSHPIRIASLTNFCFTALVGSLCSCKLAFRFALAGIMGSCSQVKFCWSRGEMQLLKLKLIITEGIPLTPLTFNLGQNGWKIKTTPSPISIMMEKMARFRCSASTWLNWGEGCFYFSFYSVQDCCHNSRPHEFQDRIAKRASRSATNDFSESLASYWTTVITR